MIPMTLGMQDTPEGAAAVQAFATALLSQYVAILMERGLERRAGLPVWQGGGETGGEYPYRELYGPLPKPCQQKLEQPREEERRPASQDARPEPRPQATRRWTDDEAMKSG